MMTPTIHRTIHTKWTVLKVSLSMTFEPMAVKMGAMETITVTSPTEDVLRLVVVNILTRKSGGFCRHEFAIYGYKLTVYFHICLFCDVN